MAAIINGQTPTPEQESETWPESVISTAEIMRYLKDSFAALHHTVAIVTKAKHGGSPGLPPFPSAEQSTSVRDRCGGPFLRSLRANGGIAAHEWHCYPTFSKTKWFGKAPMFEIGPLKVNRLRGMPARRFLEKRSSGPVFRSNGSQSFGRHVCNDSH